MSDELFLRVQDEYTGFLSSRECAIFEVAFLRIKKAQKKFPVFARDEFHAVSLLTEEVGELAKALNDAHNEPEKKREHIENAKDELLDVITVAVRLHRMIADGLKKEGE